MIKIPYYFGLVDSWHHKGLVFFFGFFLALLHIHWSWARKKKRKNGLSHFSPTLLLQIVNFVQYETFKTLFVSHTAKDSGKVMAAYAISRNPFVYDCHLCCWLMIYLETASLSSESLRPRYICVLICVRVCVCICFPPSMCDEVGGSRWWWWWWWWWKSRGNLKHKGNVIIDMGRHYSKMASDAVLRQ